MKKLSNYILSYILIGKSSDSASLYFHAFPVSQWHNVISSTIQQLALWGILTPLPLLSLFAPNCFCFILLLIVHYSNKIVKCIITCNYSFHKSNIHTLIIKFILFKLFFTINYIYLLKNYFYSNANEFYINYTFF